MMPTDLNKPLLKLEVGEAGQRLLGSSRNIPKPKPFSRDRQLETIAPKFDRLARLMESDDQGFELRSDASALAPERLLVFEVRGSMASFLKAVGKVPGLELIDEDSLPSDDIDEDPAAYLVVPNDAALRQVLSLWRRWAEGKAMVRGFTPWRDVFQTLRDIRAWGPQDRVSGPERKILLEEVEGREDHEMVRLELELVFRRDGDAAEAAVWSALLAVGGEVISRVRIPDIAYHAILADVPVSAVRSIAELDGGGLSGIEPIQHIRPQSLAANRPNSDIEPAPTIIVSEPADVSILALIDGVPVQRHPWLAAHVVVDDIFGLETDTPIDQRSHGTAMASLVVHGDRNNDEQPLPRRIISVPVLGREDKFPSDRLIVDLVYQAILNLKGGEEPSGPHVTIINISLGNLRRPFHNQLSPWARLLDRLAYRFGLLFVVSAGNNGDAFAMDGFGTRTAFEDANDIDRSSATIRSIDRIKGERRLLSPAETVNGLTIGARNFDWVPEASRRSASANIEPYVGLVISNPSSALGPGFAKSVKPELLFPGSREQLNVVGTGDGLVVRPHPYANRFAGLKVAAPSAPGVEVGEGYSNGTSGAAALASRTAHRIHDALENEYGSEFLDLSTLQRATILKALMVHPASWHDHTAARIKEIVGPADNRRHVQQKDNIRRILGYGSYDVDDAVACAADRATFWAVGSIGPEQTVPISVPIPASYGGKAQLHSLSATLAWMTPVNPGRQGYRAVRLVLKEPNWLGQLALSGNSDQPDQNQMNKGTVASRKWSGQQAAIVGGNDSVQFNVSRMPDTGMDAEGDVTFALAVTVLMPGEAEIYEQVRERVRPTLRTRI